MLQLEIFKLSSKNMHSVYTTFVFTKSRDMMKNLVTFCTLFGIVFLMHLKNARPYLGLIKITVVVVVFDYPGSSSQGIGVSRGIQRILNIES